MEKSPQIKIIRDRFNDTQSIPQWIKDDAKRWDQGEENDNIFSYGIRYMMNSKIIKSENALDYRNCSYGTICLSQNDFVKYSIKNSNSNDTVILVHTFDDVLDNILVSSKESSKDIITVTNFQINKTSGLVRSDKNHLLYQHVHPIPVDLGTKIGGNIHLRW